MGQTVEEGERDAALLFFGQPFHTFGQRAGVQRLAQQFLRARGFIGHGGHQFFVLFVDLDFARPPQPVERPVAHDRGHPGHRRAFRRVIARRMVPDIDEGLLQHFFCPVPATSYTYGDGKQFRRAELIKRRKGALVAQRAARQEVGKLFGSRGFRQIHCDSCLFASRRRRYRPRG